MRCSNLHICLLSYQKARLQESNALCLILHLTAPNFTSRLGLSVCLLPLPRKFDSNILLKLSLFHYPGHEASRSVDLIRLDHPLDFEGKFLCRGEHKCQFIYLISPDYQSGKESREKKSYYRWKMLRS